MTGVYRFANSIHHWSLNPSGVPFCAYSPETAAFQANIGLVRGLCRSEFRRDVYSAPSGSFEGPAAIDDVQ